MRRTVLVVAIALATSAFADTAQRWAYELKETATLLNEKQFDRALPRLETLTRDMYVRLGPGEASDRMFGLALGQLAVAQAGTGKTEGAIWTWEVAQNIFPAVAQVDLSAYGDAVDVLKKNILGPRPEKCEQPMSGAVIPSVARDLGVWVAR